MEIGPSSKNSWKNISPLLKGCCSFSSSIGIDVGTYYGCSNSSFSIGLNAKTDCDCSPTIGWGSTSSSSSKFEITKTYGTGFFYRSSGLLRKLNVAFNSFSSSLLICFCSKILISSTVGACEISGFT